MRLQTHEVAGPNATTPWPAGIVLTLLQAAADELEASCALEEPGGAVIAHAFNDRRPALLVEAVLGRSATPLHAAASERRAHAVTSAGACQSLMLGPDPAYLLPVSASGDVTGQLWIVPHGGELSWQAMLEHAAAVSRGMVSCGSPATHWLERALSGHGPLPPAFSDRPLHVVAVHRRGFSVGTVSDLLRLAVRRRPAPLAHVEFLDWNSGALILIAGCASPPVDVVSQWCRAAADIDGSRLAAAVAGPADDVARLPLLRSQAEQAVSALAGVGVCVPVDQVRSAIILRRLNAVLDDLPDLGRDPLQELLDHDDQRGTDLAHTLLAWLDAHGDVCAAAGALQVHANTLRYRVRRAQDVLAVDVADPETRLELHLRLRRRFASVPS